MTQPLDRTRIDMASAFGYDMGYEDGVRVGRAGTDPPTGPRIETPDERVALWYDRYHSRVYKLCGSEDEAVAAAVWMKEYDQGCPVGVQYADGRAVAIPDWDAYHREKARIRAQWLRQFPPSATLPTRTIRDPFDGVVLTVEAGEPHWLGRVERPGEAAQDTSG